MQKTEPRRVPATRALSIPKYLLEIAKFFALWILGKFLDMTGKQIWANLPVQKRYVILGAAIETPVYVLFAAPSASASPKIPQ